MKLFNIKNKPFFIILLILYVLVILALTVPIRKYEMNLKGNIAPIAEEIEIEGLKSYNEFYSIYIISYTRPTLFQLLIGNLSGEVDVSKNIRVTSSSEDFFRGSLLEELSFQYAIINAYSKAQIVDPNISINYTLNSYVITYSVNENLNLGDRFVSVNGRSFTDFTDEELTRYFQDNDNITLEIIKEDSLEEVVISKGSNGLFGIIYDKYYEILETTPSYKTYYQNDSKVGPSGGLLQTLEIYSILTGEKHNKIISGTGTIEYDGEVGAIGAVKQKIYTANKKVDIFFCPEENYEEALKAYNDIKNPTFELVKVGSFDEALEKLLP